MHPDFRRPRRPRADADDLLIKLVAAIVLILIGVRLFVWYEHAKSAEEVARAQAIEAEARLSQQQAQQRSRQAELAQQQASIRANGYSGEMIYKCETSRGIQLQSLPCEPGQSTAWARPVGTTAFDEAEADRLASIARHEAEVRQYTQMYGDRAVANSFGATAPVGEMEQRRARCTAQKAYRDDVLRRVGLNRTFDLLRSLDEGVYEACKGT